MRLFNRKKKPKKEKIQFSQYLATLVGLIFLVLVSFPLAKNLSQKYKIDSEIKQLEKEIESVENSNDGLKKVMDYMSSEQFVEEQARLKFGLKKPGEQAAAIKDFNELTENEEEKAGQEKPLYLVQGMGNEQARKLTNPEKWYNYFFNSENSIK